MIKKYQELLVPLALTNGAILPNRLVMPPYTVTDATPDGQITPALLAYFARRTQVAGMQIVGAATIAEEGKHFPSQMSVAADQHVEGLTKLAQTIKAEGAKAVLQIYHGGRQAHAAYELFGEIVAPSSVVAANFPHAPRTLSDEEIKVIIRQFGEATGRAIDAGFDGVEIHGANMFLIHQFFSAATNQRQDEWGGDLARRMAFPLAVVKEVKRVVAQKGADNFIVGYRLVPEEYLEKEVGYTFTETKQLLDRIAEEGLDYIHLSIFTNYDGAAKDESMPYGMAVKEVVGERAAVIIVGNIKTADLAQDALRYSDLVAIGKASIVDPDFATKIANEQAHLIRTEISAESGAELALPPEFIQLFKSASLGITLPGIEHV